MDEDKLEVALEAAKLTDEFTRGLIGIADKYGKKRKDMLFNAALGLLLLADDEDLETMEVANG